MGVGLLLGAPTGMSMKYWVGPYTAWDAAIGVRSEDLQVHTDYLWNPETFPLEYGSLPIYLGMGVRLHAKDDHDEDTVFGIRLVGGASFHFPEHPIELFAEIAPSVRVAPSLGGDVDAGIGVRYYFRTAP